MYQRIVRSNVRPQRRQPQDIRTRRRRQNRILPVGFGIHSIRNPPPQKRRRNRNRPIRNTSPQTRRQSRIRSIRNTPPRTRGQNRYHLHRTTPPLTRSQSRNQTIPSPLSPVAQPQMRPLKIVKENGF